MVRCAPRPCGTDVVANGSVLLPLVRNTEDIRNRRHAATAGPACTPGVGLPRNDRAILFRRYLHSRVSGRTGSRNLQLGITLEHDADRLAASFLGDLCSKDFPTVGGELAAETAANVILMNSNVGAGIFSGSAIWPAMPETFCVEMWVNRCSG